MADLDALRVKRDALVVRLERGDEQITARESARGEAPKKWVDEWLDLLTEYEHVEDEIDRHSAQSSFVEVR